ncbi:MAG: hypothetical protein PHI02_07695 [Sulfurovaceae bacterium]|nr:hypothetical protein [Sulfurovaceae bacterium]
MAHFLQKLDDKDKVALRDELLVFADIVGGKNSFLKILESIRHSSPHPLVSKDPILRFVGGYIKWNKNVHKNNLMLLSIRMNARSDEVQNLMPTKEDKSYKNSSNMLRSLSPLTFEVVLNKEPEKTVFSFKMFDIIDSQTTNMNKIFEVIFFSPINMVKKLINLEDTKD